VAAVISVHFAADIGSLPTVASVTAAGLRGRARFKTIHRAPLLCPRTTMTRALGTTLSGLRTSTAGRSNSGCRNSFRLRLVCPHVVTCRSGREDDPKSGGGILRSALTLGQSGLLPKRLLSVTRPRQSLDQEQHQEGQASGSGQVGRFTGRKSSVGRGWSLLNSQ
jgi:hypothetical protein